MFAEYRCGTQDKNIYIWFMYFRRRYGENILQIWFPDMVEKEHWSKDNSGEKRKCWITPIDNYSQKASFTNSWLKFWYGTGLNQLPIHDNLQIHKYWAVIVLLNWYCFFLKICFFISLQTFTYSFADVWFLN